MSRTIIDSLLHAVAASPDDVPLRLHLAELLIDNGRHSEAVAHCAAALHLSPDSESARELMARTLAPQPSGVGPAVPYGFVTHAPSTPPGGSSAAPSETAAALGGAATAPSDRSAAHSEAATAPPNQPPPTAPPAPSEAAATPAAPPAPSEAAATPAAPPAPSDRSAAPSNPASAPSEAAAAPTAPPSAADQPPSTGDNGYDWSKAEADLGSSTAAPFISGTPPAPASGSPAAGHPSPAAGHPSPVAGHPSPVAGPPSPAPTPGRPTPTPGSPTPVPRSAASPDADPGDWEVETAGVVLADVGGLAHVKARLEASFLAPMRNPELRRLYGKSLRGGLLLYGPPGVGKTFIARAVAGEMGAGFLNVTLTDILDPYIGRSETRLHAVFEQARAHAPCVVFLDELDAIGIKRSMLRSAGMRGVVNQLLQELDGIGAVNDGVYVLAATNTPWDIDPALRRPGRLDRAVLVLPPDEPARAAILHSHLKERPVEGIDLTYLARATEGLTGADLAHLCETAAEKALLDSVRTATPRMIQMRDLLAALTEVRPSTGPWFDVARNVVEYADHTGEYAELRTWMKGRKLL